MKRKAAPSRSVGNWEERSAKRIRSSQTTESKPKPDPNVRQPALDYLQHLKRATDKNGRLICTAFLELPDPVELPDYYELIFLPISIETLEAKIERNGFTNLSEFESDVKRMIANAKKYNESKSEVYEDAERIRKLTFNYMTKINPAYKGGNYVAVPTPEPAEPQGYPGLARGTAANTKTKTVPKISLKSSAAETPKASPATKPSQSSKSSQATREASRSQSLAAAIPTATPPDGDFAGKTFQQAQDMVLREALSYEVDGLEIFTPFANLPSRSLTEYYATIKQPTSLKGTVKKVHGVKGRQEITGASEFKTWDAFEAEVSKIWTNARTFNEDGSDMFLLADTFEQWFLGRLAEVRAVVPEPNAPTLRLNLSKSTATNIKLRLGQKEQATTPTAKGGTPATTLANGTAIDHRSSETPSSQPKTAADNARVSRRPSSSQSQSTRQDASPFVPTNANPQSSMNGAVSNGASAPSMLPPVSATINGLNSGNSLPMPNVSVATVSHTQAPPKPRQVAIQPPPGFDSKWRSEANSIEEALLPLLRVYSVQIPNGNTLPNGIPMPAAPSVAKPLSMSIPPHPHLTQQSLTLNLPLSQQHLVLHPKLHSSLLGGRPYRIFVTVNGARVGNAPNPEHKLQFEARCAPGVNRIEVEIVAVRTAPKRAALPATSTAGPGVVPEALAEGSMQDGNNVESEEPAATASPGNVPSTTMPNGVGSSATSTSAAESNGAVYASSTNTGTTEGPLEVERISLFVHVLRT